MRGADRSGAAIALVAGDRDIEAGTVGREGPRRPASRSMSPIDAVVAEVLRRLS